MLGWIRTIVGPLLLKAGAMAIPGAQIVNALRAMAVAAVLAIGAWGGVAAANWWHRDKITPAEAVKRCDDTITAATLAARDKALRDREAAIAEREVRMGQDAAALAAARKEMEEARGHGPADGTVCVGGDDEWLRRWREGKRDGARRR